jgi:hypothetical protein
LTIMHTALNGQQQDRMHTGIWERLALPGSSRMVRLTMILTSLSVM